MQSKKIVFLIRCMTGGGAERVVSLLSREFADCGYNLTLILTHQSKEEALLHTVDDRVKVISLPDEVKCDSTAKKKHLMKKELLQKKFRQIIGRYDDNEFVVRKYEIRNFDEVEYLKGYFKSHPKSTAIAFLYDSIFLSLLSVQNTNKLIISERGDPREALGSKTDVAFFKSMFNKADAMVFQSPDAKAWYVENASIKNGKVIFNPIKSDLPERFTGERRKTVVDFCRISSQKNLHLLVKAFAKFNEDFPEYELCIYGDAVGNGVDGYVESVQALVDTLECKDKIRILPAQKDIHNIIKDCAMFVSSSDFEGMSNSMLEAMGMGLPTICTDCPAGGARAIIKDHENGILVPIKDDESMYKAMKEVAENKELAEKLSMNATKLREQLALDKIIDQWMEIIE